MGLATILAISAGLVSVSAQTPSADTVKAISSNLKSLQVLPTIISGVKPPDIKNPDWLQAELDAEAAARQQTYRSLSQNNGTVTYDVSTRGNITANLAEFKAEANQTLNDARGWSRLGITFQEVASGGDFTLVLSEASWVSKFAPGSCSDVWSCTVGRYVIINQDRWLYASDAWNQSGGSLRDYRNMVINHETGHWLGHGHLYTCGAGQFAPVMMQQSINLNGCNFNPWPLNSELWSSTLGI